MFRWPLAIKTRKIKNVDYFTKGVYTFVVGCRLPAGIMHQSKVFPFLDHSWVHNHVWTNDPSSSLFWCCYPGASLACVICNPGLTPLQQRSTTGSQLQTLPRCQTHGHRWQRCYQDALASPCGKRWHICHCWLSLCWGPLSSFGGSKKPWGPAEDHQQVTPSKISTSKRLRLLRRYCTIGYYRTLVICNVSFAELFADAQTNSNRFEATGRPPILFKQMSTRRQKQQFFVSTGLHSPAKDPHETFIIDRSVEHAIFSVFSRAALGTTIPKWRPLWDQCRPVQSLTLGKIWKHLNTCLMSL